MANFPKDKLNEMLFEAVNVGDIDEVKRLLESGASANAENQFGYTALMEAARIGDLEIAKFLLDYGAAINAITDTDGGTTALSRAASSGHLDMAKFLLAHGANVNAKTSGNCTALYSAVLWVNRDEDCRKVAEFLVDHGANVDERDELGATILMSMAGVGSLEAVELLLELGANENAKDKKGSTVLDHAKAGGIYASATVVETLLAHGADPNEPLKNQTKS